VVVVVVVEVDVLVVVLVVDVVDVVGGSSIIARASRSQLSFNPL